MILNNQEEKSSIRREKLLGGEKQKQNKFSNTKTYMKD